MISCPFHKGGQERNPSCGIKRYTDEYGSAGTIHCFSCGVTTDILGMLKEVLGVTYNENEIETNFGISVITTSLNLKPKKQIVFKIPDKSNLVSHSLLKRFSGIYHPYLKSRGIGIKTANKYDIGFDEVNQHITFPIKDIYNNCIGIGRRSIVQKEYYYPSGMTKPLYGLYELSQPVHELYVVEGPFNLWSLNEWGRRAVALLGTGTSFQYEQLITIDCDIYVLALDPDDAGRNGIRKLGSFLQSNNKKVEVLDLPNGRDVNDLSLEEFRNMYILTFSAWLKKYN